MSPAGGEPPAGAPPGTKWFGGPVSRLRASLRVYGDATFDADAVTRLLGAQPTRVTAAPVGAPRKMGWLLTIERDDGDLDALVAAALARVTSDLAAWARLTAGYRVDFVCAALLGSVNQGLVLAPETMALLVERGLALGLDVYAPED